MHLARQPWPQTSVKTACTHQLCARMRIHSTSPGSYAALPPEDLPGGSPCVASSSTSGNDAESLQPLAQQPGGPFARVKQWLTGNRKLDRQRLAEFGLGAFAAYGIISNMNAGVCMTISWLTVVRQHGVTPLSPGMWPQFLGVYAGMYIASNFLRPIRLSIALAAAPVFNTFLDKVQTRAGVNRAAAFGILLAMIAVGSCTVIFGTIALLGGFPSAGTGA